jgi:hypothetical protein
VTAAAFNHAGMLARTALHRPQHALSPTSTATWLIVACLALGLHLLVKLL